MGGRGDRETDLVDVEADGQVLPSALSQRGSLVFLLQADQNLVLRFGHVKHVLQRRKKQRANFFTPPPLRRWRTAKTKRKEVERDLWVLKEGAPVVDAASSSVEKRVVVATPGAPDGGLLPGLVDTQVGRVDETAQDEVGEVGDKVIECHPAEEKRREEVNRKGSRERRSRKVPPGGAGRK